MFEEPDWPEWSWLPVDVPPQYAGGERGGLSKYYRDQADVTAYGLKEDPYMRDWANQANVNQARDRQSLMDAYNQLGKQAAGGSTPQQEQMLSGFSQNAQNQATLANSARGGAYGASAAHGALTQNAGIAGQQNYQAYQEQRAGDRLNAMQQQQEIATQMRAQDLQAQGMTAEDALRTAQLQVQGRGLNIQRQLGFAGLEGQATGDEYQSYIDAYRRYKTLKKINQQKDVSSAQTATQGASTAIGTVASLAALFSDVRVKEAAFQAGVQHGIGKASAPKSDLYFERTNPFGSPPRLSDAEAQKLRDAALREYGSLSGAFAAPSPIGGSPPPYFERTNPFGPAPDKKRLSDAEAQKLRDAALREYGSLSGAFAAPSPIGAARGPDTTEIQNYARQMQALSTTPPAVHDSISGAADTGAYRSPDEMRDLYLRALARSDDGLMSDERAKHRYDTSEHSQSPIQARVMSDALLDKLAQSQSVYRYKSPQHDTDLANPGQPHLGIMAQDLEQTPTGASLVKRDPSGMRYVSTPAGLSAAFAGLGRLNERVRELERR